MEVDLSMVTLLRRGASTTYYMVMTDSGERTSQGLNPVFEASTGPKDPSLSTLIMSLILPWNS